MNPHPDTVYPSDYYLQGLRDLNPDVANNIYKEFRQAIMRQIQQAGGTHGDAAVFFRTAVTEAAFQARKAEKFPSEVSFFQYLNALALAHFKDWEDEKKQPETPPESDSQAEETTETDLALKALLPTSEQMLETRQRIFAHRKWEQLPAAQQQSLLALVQDADLSPDLRQFPDYESAANSTHGSALTAFKTALGAAQETWDTPLPHYAQAAIGDTFLGKIRDLTQQAERRTDASTSTSENIMDSRIRN
ncbi:MAG: hypothetical protein IT269_02090 [Saprospiraceae bacterium]|nr:hypothetical protein [Saprospiraceae bacterium]